MIHTVNVTSPSRFCTVWCTSAGLSPVNQTESTARYPTDFTSPPRRMCSEAFSLAATPECSKPWRLYTPTEFKWVLRVVSCSLQCNVSNCSRCVLREARRRRRGDKVRWLICRSLNKDSPIIFPIRKTRSRSEWVAYPAYHHHKAPVSRVYISDFQLLQQRLWLCLFPRPVCDDLLWEESPHRVSFSQAFIVHQGGKAFITVLYRILWVSVWPSLYVIMRFAGCEQATAYDAPVWLFTVAVRKQAVANENKCPDGREKKMLKNKMKTFVFS